MNVLDWLLPSGRLAPRPFILGAVLIYAASVGSQALVGMPALGAGALWIFALVQALLVWCWYVLHARRLRDGDIGEGAAIGIAALYVLAVVLLSMATMVIRDEDMGMAGTGAVDFGFLPLFRALARAAAHGGFGLVLSGFVAVAALSVALGVGFSVWTATRPSHGPQRRTAEPPALA